MAQNSNGMTSLLLRHWFKYEYDMDIGIPNGVCVECRAERSQPDATVAATVRVSPLPSRQSPKKWGNRFHQKKKKEKNYIVWRCNCCGFNLHENSSNAPHFPTPTPNKNTPYIHQKPIRLSSSRVTHTFRLPILFAFRPNRILSLPIFNGVTVELVRFGAKSFIYAGQNPFNKTQKPKIQEEIHVKLSVEKLRGRLWLPLRCESAESLRYVSIPASNPSIADFNDSLVYSMVIILRFFSFFLSLAVALVFPHKSKIPWYLPSFWELHFQPSHNQIRMNCTCKVGENKHVAF